MKRKKCLEEAFSALRSFLALSILDGPFKNHEVRQNSRVAEWGRIGAPVTKTIQMREISIRIGAYSPMSLYFYSPKQYN